MESRMKYWLRILGNGKPKRQRVFRIRKYPRRTKVQRKPVRKVKAVKKKKVNRKRKYVSKSGNGRRYVSKDNNTIKQNILANLTSIQGNLQSIQRDAYSIEDCNTILQQYNAYKLQCEKDMQTLRTQLQQALSQREDVSQEQINELIKGIENSQKNIVVLNEEIIKLNNTIKTEQEKRNQIEATNSKLQADIKNKEAEIQRLKTAPVPESVQKLLDCIEEYKKTGGGGMFQQIGSSKVASSASLVPRAAPSASLLPRSASAATLLSQAASTTSGSSNLSSQRAVPSTSTVRFQSNIRPSLRATTASSIKPYTGNNISNEFNDRLELLEDEPLYKPIINNVRAKLGAATTVDGQYGPLIEKYLRELLKIKNDNAFITQLAETYEANING